MARVPKNRLSCEENGLSIRQLESLVLFLDEPRAQAAGVVSWACPVPVFGNLEQAEVATIGINPSNREFVDINGAELCAKRRRFPTLKSLRLTEWRDARECHLREIQKACTEYFKHNPYDTWFAQLEKLLAPLGITYYPPFEKVCHLDVVPYTTFLKWGKLPAESRRFLHEVSVRSLAESLANSRIRVVILNGATVSQWFERSIDNEFELVEMPSWTLKQRNGRNIRGVAYYGSVSRISDLELGRLVAVFGYNHNIQSSYGVTTAIRTSIADWLNSQIGLDSI